MVEFEARFKNFLARRQDCKIVDDGSHHTPGGVADFLLDGGNICAELKCLDEDTLEKLQAFAAELIETRDLAVYGNVPFEEIIDGQADRGELNRTAIYKIARRLETEFRDANKQLKNTKKTLQLPRAQGLLIFANTKNQALDPKLAGSFISWLFNRRKPSGAPVCSSIDAVLYLTLIHDVGDLGGVRLQPAITLLRDDRPEYKRLDDYLQTFLEDWAAFNGIPMFAAEKPFEEIEDFSRTPMRRMGLAKGVKGFKIAINFEFPALCPKCGATFAHPAGNGNSMYINEPQKELLVVGLVCPQCDNIAATRVADLAVDRDGDTISVYPWLGRLENISGADWRKFIDRSGGPASATFNNRAT